MGVLFIQGFISTTELVERAVSRVKVGFGAFLCALLLIASPTIAHSDFFAPANERGTHLPPDRIYPQGRIFPYGGYSGNAAREKAHGFTLHGPVYGDANYTMVESAKAAGMYAIYTVGIPMNFYETDGKPALELSAAQIAAEIKRQVDAVVAEDTIAWWYLIPEEMRPWRAKEMEYLEVATRIIRENDPQNRPVWMYDPGHRNAKDLAVTAGHLDILGKGMYTNYAGQLGSRIWNRYGIDQQLQALALNGRPGAIQIAVPEMFQEPAPENAVKIPAWVRHDVYLALVSGAQGIVPFSLANRSGFSQSSWDAYYDAYVQTAQEITGEPGVGQVFLFGEWRDDLRLTITDGEQMVWPQLKPGFIDTIFAYPAVSMANIAYGTERYLFVVNSSEEPVAVHIAGFPAETVYVRDAFTGQPLPTIAGDMSLTLPGLGVAGLRLSQGYVWLSSPLAKTVAAPEVPIQIVTPGLSLTNIQVDLDGEQVYAGTNVPTELNLRSARLSAGSHQLVVTASDVAGNLYHTGRSFAVEHFSLAEPALMWGTRLKGSVSIALQLNIAASEVQLVTIRLTAIINGESGTQYVVYTEKSPPAALLLETAQFADGAYDLEIDIITTTGITTSFSQRVILANWETLTDTLLPPQNAGWFGIQDRLKVVDRSEGWEFISTQALHGGRGGGDVHRMRPQPNSPQYLTWQLPRLHQYTFTLYARQQDIDQQVTVAVSPDGQMWHNSDFAVQVAEETADGWLKLLVTGIVPLERLQQYVRITLQTESLTDVLELGEVFLVGVR